METNENYEAIEWFDKCRSLLHVLDGCQLEEPDRDAIVWLAIDCLEKLGNATGITRSTQQ